MRRRRCRAVVAALAVLAAVAAGGCTSDDDEPGTGPTVAGGADVLPGPVPSGLALRPAPADSPVAPRVTGTLTDGSPLALADLWTDRPVVLVFFSSWCTTCGQRQDGLSELARDYRDRVVFVGVAGEDEPDGMQAYLRQHRVEYPVVWDESGVVRRSYAVREPPAVALVAKGGALLRGWPGGVDAATLDGALRELVLGG